MALGQAGSVLLCAASRCACITLTGARSIFCVEPPARPLIPAGPWHRSRCGQAPTRLRLQSAEPRGSPEPAPPPGNASLPQDAPAVAPCDLVRRGSGAGLLEGTESR